MLKNPSMSPSMVGTFNHIPEEEIRNYYDANSPNSPNIDKEENGKSFSHIPMPSFSKINIHFSFLLVFPGLQCVRECVRI